MAISQREEAQVSPARARKPTGVTLRAVALGLVASGLISGWCTFARTGADTSDVNITHLPVSFFVVFMLIVTANLMLRTRPGHRGLAPPELFTIMAMGLLAGMIPARGLTGIWLGLMAAPHYLATPENGWIEYIQPNLPFWLYPGNDYGQTTWLYEGLPKGAAIPWEEWVMPLFWWLTLILAGFMVCICIVVVLRKQWVEYERLDYPLVGRILDLVDDAEDESGDSRWPRLFGSRLFWTGFTIAFGIIAWNSITYFAPNWPRINMSPGGGRFYPFRLCPWLITHINTYTIGLSYFVKLEILFSIWFFHLLFMAQIVLLRKTGFQLGGKDKPGTSWGDPMIQWQCLGALVAFVLWGLWTARAHLRAVFRKAFYGSPEVDDSEEILPYRTAILGFALGTIYIVAWLYQAGVTLGLIALIIPTAVILYIALARFVCESGTLYLGLPTGPLDIGYQMVGTEDLTARTIVAASTTTALRWMLFMPALSQGAKAVDRIRGDKRPVFWAILFGLAVALAVNIGVVLHSGYTYGAYNFTEFPFKLYAPRLYDGIVTQVRNPTFPSWQRMAVFAAGGIILMALTGLRYRLPRWPIHPIGFVVSTTSIRLQFTSILLVWTFKAIIMRIGGVGLYRRLYPLFFGLVVGRAAGVLFSFIIDLIWFPGAGHGVHGWA